MQFCWESFIDWVGVVSAVGTVAAAGFAVWSIQLSSAQAKRNAQMIVDERQRDIKIELLTELVDFSNTFFPNTAVMLNVQRSAYARLQITDAPLPYTRARYANNVNGSVRLEDLDVEEERPTAPGESADDMPTRSGETVRTRVQNELIAEIQKTLS